MRHLLERRQCPVLKSRKFIDSSTTPARVESAPVAKQKIMLFVTGIRFQHFEFRDRLVQTQRRFRRLDTGN